MPLPGAFHGPVLRLLAEGAADGSWPKIKDAETVASAIFGAVVIPALDQLVPSGSLDPGRPGPSCVWSPPAWTGP